jgi:hypothetical protein
MEDFMFDDISSSLLKVFETFSTQRIQYLVYLGVSLVIFSFTIVLYFSEHQVFQRFLGSIDPLVAILAAIVVGFILLSFLLTQKWFDIFEKGNLMGPLHFAGLAALLGVIMIIVDTRIIFPADINILFPQSLLFYPAIAFFVEILFHVLPLTVLITVMRLVLKNFNFNTIVWISIFIISIAEPIYQTMDMASSKHFPNWAVAYVGFHIFLINFFQLFIFKKYDFISMYSFRLVYYLFWHIGWGYVRLSWLY